MCKCGECAEEALRIRAVPLVNMAFAQNDFVDHVEDIRRIVHITVAQFEQNIVGYEDACNKPGDELVVYRQGDDGGQTVANAQTGQHAKQSHVGKTVGSNAHALHEAEVGIVCTDHAAGESEEPYQREADAPEQESALGYLAGACQRPRKVELSQRQIGGDTHNKHERREDKVGRCQAYPLGVQQRGEALFFWSARVVYQYHGCDGDASQNVNGKNARAFLLCRSLHGG